MGMNFTDDTHQVGATSHQIQCGRTTSAEAGRTVIAVLGRFCVRAGGLQQMSAEV